MAATAIPIDTLPSIDPASGEVVGYFEKTSPALVHGIVSRARVAQIEWAKRAGYARLETSNDTRNVPIQRLNEFFGYTEQPSVLTILGVLVPKQT